MHKNTIFFLGLLAIGSLTSFSSALARRSSQAVDLLEYDLARLNIEKERMQCYLDKTFQFQLAGGISLACTGYLGKQLLTLAKRNSEDDAPMAILLFAGGMLAFIIGIKSAITPWAAWLEKTRIEKRIAAIKKQIKHLSERTTA